MRSRCRTAARITAVLTPVAWLWVAGSSAVADTPSNWPQPEPMSKLHALLLFVGAPAGLFVVIALLVMAPSVAKGPRYRPGLSWWANPEWFGGPAVERAERPALESGAVEPDEFPMLPAAAENEGGASARW